MLNDLRHLLTVLRPIGHLYGWLMRLRSFLYSHNIFDNHSFSVPVISVGNLTMGGSGKTPVVIFLAQLLLKNNIRPAIISRGYGGKAKNEVNIVSDGKSLLLDSTEAGDEPRLIAETVPQAVVLTGKKRKHPCSYATKHFACDVIILDDGFQHLSVKRDLDLVLFNEATLQQNYHVLPGGVLREPFSALQRADSFLITGCSGHVSSNTQKFISFLQTNWKNTPLFLTRFLPQHFIDGAGKNIAFSAVNNKFMAFCGIASPQRFQKSIEDLPQDCVGFKSFPDHQSYTQDEIDALTSEAQDKGASAFLTTEKDLVKIKSLNLRLPIYALHMAVLADKDLEDFIMQRINSCLRLKAESGKGGKS